MIKVGDVFSETQFYTVESINNNEIILKNELDIKIEVTKDFVDEILYSADTFTKTEKLNATELADVFLNNINIAMTVCFRKKDESKTAKSLKKEKEDMKAKFKAANMTELQKLIDEFVDNPIQAIIPGEERIISGFHSRMLNELGRVQFVDMKVAKIPGNYDNRNRLVDPRTLKYIIVNNVKYILK